LQHYQLKIQNDFQTILNENVHNFFISVKCEHNIFSKNPLAASNKLITRHKEERLDRIAKKFIELESQTHPLKKKSHGNNRNPLE
jgi:hypothetical protein